MRKRVFTLVVSVLVSVGLVAWLLRQVPFSRLAAILLAAPPHWLLLMTTSYFAMYLARAARLRVLAQRAPFGRLFTVVATHNALVRVLPFRTGELTFPLLASRFAFEDPARSAIVLVHTRLLDAAVLLPIFSVATLTLGGVIPGGRSFALAGLALLVLTVLGMAKLASLGRRTARLLGKRAVGERLRLAANHWDGLAPTTITWATLWTLVMWGCNYATMWTAARACGIHVSVGSIISAGTVSILASVMPLSVGAIGLIESGMVIGLVLLNQSRERAIAMGLLFQWGTLLFALTAAGLAVAFTATRESVPAPR